MSSKKRLFTSLRQSRRTSDEASRPGGRSGYEQSGSPEAISLIRADLGQASSPKSRTLSPPESLLTFRSRSRSPSQHWSSDPQGLTLVHTPDTPHQADIIFIHGLGGSSRLTWCKNKNLDNFWPGKWLPDEPDLNHARIFTFGYNADFRSSAQSANLGISDFAKNLLYDMLYFRDGGGDVSRLGQAPIIFVVHSMGGLVFKKAYLDGQLDDRFGGIISAIHAVMFLSTPHRGSNLAEVLNRLLSTTLRSAPKQYVADLAKQAPFLRTINDQFRHLAPRLQIFSFYETLQTSLGFTSAMILDEESAKLGYPGEVSRSLHADHHDVCKFSSPEDANYRVVLGALKSLVAANDESPSDEEICPEADLARLRELLSIPVSTEQDYDTFLSHRVEGTCEWILDQPGLAEWASSDISTILCLHGRPGRGKSILASYLIRTLEDHEYAVQSFFFRFGDETRRTVSSLLKSLAYQVASHVPDFGVALLRLIEGGHRTKDSEWRSTWRKMFPTLLFKMESAPPLFWVIDGLDECSAPTHFLELLSDLAASAVPIHVLITSRWTPALASPLERLESKLQTSILSIDQDQGDIERYVQYELEYLSWDPEIKSEIVEKVKRGANDNFLWAHLVVQEIKECHTEDDVRERLEEIPPGMDALYARMEHAVTLIKRPADLRLSRMIFICALYARRSLTLTELTTILQPGFGRLLSIANTVHRLCGHFITTDATKPMQLIHETARDYLTTTPTLPFSLNPTDAHEEMFDMAMTALTASKPQPRMGASRPEPPAMDFGYYTTSWPFHLEASKRGDGGDGQLDLLVAFFSKQFVLEWIFTLATMKRLTVLADASKYLNAFLKRKRKADSAREPTFRRYEDIEFLELWPRDLLKILGKFGYQMSQNPECVHRGVAPFCPRSSAMYKTFGQDSNMKVHGLPDGWDDCLVRLSTNSTNQASILCCSSRHVGIVDEAGIATLWDCVVFAETKRLNHGEPVYTACFSPLGAEFATCGFRSTKVWNCQTGDVIHAIENPLDTMSMCLEFDTDGGSLIMATDQHKLLTASLRAVPMAWGPRAPINVADSGIVEGAYLNSPTSLTLSPDRAMIAATYRGFPCTIWTLEPPKILHRISRNRTPSSAITPLPFVSSVCWQPDSRELMGVFLDGHLFRLNVATNSYVERPPDPGQVTSFIACSPDGHVFAVVGVHGTVKLYDYASFTCLYHLRSADADSRITSLIFSADGGQFYDIRGASCSVWEPAALVRLSATTVGDIGDDETAPSQSHDESSDQSNPVSEAAAHTGVPIAVMAPMPGTRSTTALCDDEGKISLCDSIVDKYHQIGQTAAKFRVSHLVWDHDGRRLCYSELSGRLSVVVVEPSAAGEGGWAQKLVTRFRPKLDDQRVTQLLFLPKSGHLLVATARTAQMWALDSRPPRLVAERHLSFAVGWLPLILGDSELLLSVDSKGIAVHEAQGLEPVPELRSKTMPLSRASSSLEDSAITHQDLTAISTHHNNYIILSSTTGHASRHNPTLHILDISSLHISGSSPRPTLEDIAFIQIPRHVIQDIARPLTIMRSGLLIYIDRHLGVSSWNVSGGPGVTREIGRRFTIPRDWLPLHDLGLVHVTQQGTLLCPTKGGVTAIEADLGSM